MANPSKTARARAAAAAGVLFLKGGFTLALLVVFASLPPFRVGVWFQTEPMTIAFAASSGATAIGLLLLSVARPRPVLRLLVHPFALLPLGMAAWSLAVAPWAEVPVLSVVGGPEMGQGTIWFLNLAVLVVAAGLLYRSRRHRRWLASLALGAAAVAAALTAYERYLTGAVPKWAWSPFFFPDYLAFFGIFAIVVAETWLAARRPAARAAGRVFGLAVIAASANWSAMVLVAVAGLLVVATERIVAPGPRLKRLLLSAAVFAVPAVAMIGVATIAYLGSRFQFPYTQWSRHVLNKMAIEVFSDAPLRLLTGFGWGHFVDVVIAHAAQGGVRLYGGSNFGPNWDAISLAYFHSHNALVEAVLSAGVVALALAWLAPAAIPLFARAKHVALAGGFGFVLAGLETVWFQFPVSLPLLAMALGGLARPLRPRFARFDAAVARRIVGAALVPALLLEAFALRVYVGDAIEYRDALYYDDELTEADATKGRDCATAFADRGRGGIHLAWLLGNYASRLAKRVEANEPIGEREVARLRLYICATEHRFDERVSLRLPVAALLVRSELAYDLNHPELRAIAGPHLESWGSRLDRVLKRAPRRSDLAIPYLSWLLERSDEREILRATGRILASDPLDPVGLWFSGAVLLGIPARADEGVARMKRSVAAGIERFMPVSPELMGRILKAPGPRDSRIPSPGGIG